MAKGTLIYSFFFFKNKTKPNAFYTWIKTNKRESDSLAWYDLQVMHNDFVYRIPILLMSCLCVVWTTTNLIIRDGKIKFMVSIALT